MRLVSRASIVLLSRLTGAFANRQLLVTSDCDLLGLLLRGLNHVPSSCLAVGFQLSFVRLCVMSVRCRENNWRSCRAAWQGRWLHLVVKLLGGRVHIVSWVVKMTGDIEQAVASCSDCKGLALHCCSAVACLLAVPSSPSPSGFPCSSRFLELRW